MVCNVLLHWSYSCKLGCDRNKHKTEGDKAKRSDARMEEKVKKIEETNSGEGERWKEGS